MIIFAIIIYIVLSYPVFAFMVAQRIKQAQIYHRQQPFVIIIIGIIWAYITTQLKPFQIALYTLIAIFVVPFAVPIILVYRLFAMKKKKFSVTHR